MQEDARARIYDEYDKRNRKGVYAECTDPDSDDFYLTPEEKKKALDEKLKAESDRTPLERRKESEARIYGKPAPEEGEPENDRPGAAQAAEAFWERHPDISEDEWKRMTDPNFLLTAPDLRELKARADASGSREDVGRLLERIAEVYPGYKERQERAAVVQEMMRSRSPIKL